MRWSLPLVLRRLGVAVAVILGMGGLSLVFSQNQPNPLPPDKLPVEKGDDPSLGPLVDKLASTNPDERIGAIKALGELGKKAKPAIPSLVGALTDDSPVSNAASRALQQIGEPAIADLLKALEKGNAKMRYLVIHELSTMEAVKQKNVYEAFLKAVHDDDELVVTVALWALTHDVARPKSLVPVLLGYLRDQKVSEQLRAAAIHDLRQYRSDAALAVPDLLAIFRDRKNNLRSQAAAALGDIAPTNKELFTTLLAELKDPKEDPAIRATASEVLGKMGPFAKDAVPEFYHVLKQTTQAKEQDKHFQLRRVTLLAVGSLKPDKEAIPVLMAVLRDQREDWVIRWAALQAMADITPDEKAVSGLVEVLEDPEVAMARGMGMVVRSKVISQLGKMGPKAKGAIPALRRIATGGRIEGIDPVECQHLAGLCRIALSLISGD